MSTEVGLQKKKKKEKQGRSRKLAMKELETEKSCSGEFREEPNAREENQVSVQEFELMANELEAEKSRSEELRRELEKIRMEKQQLESATVATPLATPAVDVESQSISSYNENFRPHSTEREKSTLEESRFMASINQLSISSVNVPECKPIGDEGEIQRHAYEQWRTLLVDSMQLAGISDEPTQFMIFKVKAGNRLLDIFKNAKSDENAPDSVSRPFSNAMHRLNAYFGSGSDLMLQRRKLALMFQKPEESDSAYITRVATTARMCEYGEERESEAMLGAVADHARCKDVRLAALKILHRKGSFTDLIDKVREIECIRLSESFFKERHDRKEQASMAPVSADFPRNDRQYARQSFSSPTFYQRGKSRGFPARPPFRSTGTQRFFSNRKSPYVQEGGQRFSSGTKCWRCTSVYHDPSVCHAIDKVCRNCGREGHIKVACKTRIHTGTKREHEYEATSSDAPPRKIAAIEKHEDDVTTEKVSDDTDN